MTKQEKLLTDCVDAWIEEWHRNQEMIAKLTARLRVQDDALRIVAIASQTVMPR